ncbi:hypothetical protein [Herbaspirillum sp. YR522]|uniref:hypothetical protein n=1 Tax=Herbaspirillum sp. YR522 TaxID=1144342 RepID=UPI00138ADF68|nr:hypothetical protein [Herbaspirillum sp. YR522]
MMRALMDLNMALFPLISVYLLSWFHAQSLPHATERISQHEVLARQPVFHCGDKAPVLRLDQLFAPRRAACSRATFASGNLVQLPWLAWNSGPGAITDEKEWLRRRRGILKAHGLHVLSIRSALLPTRL